MTLYSTFKSRLFAGLIDGLLFLPSLFIYYNIDRSDKYVFVAYHIVYIVVYLVYSVYFHGKHGQTIGKRVMKIRVLNESESAPIGYKKAFLRDSVWLLIDVTAIIYLLVITEKSMVLTEQNRTEYDALFGKLAGIWILLELISFWATSKRRAVHDFIANSVVVNLEKSDSAPLRMSAKEEIK